MRIAIFGIEFYEKSRGLYQQIIDRLEREKCDIYVNEKFYDLVKDKVVFKKEPNTFNQGDNLKNKIDVLFTVGGDGTILESVTYIRDSGVPILGINLGNLGFLSSVSRDEIKTAIDTVLQNNYIINKRSLLKLNSDFKLFGDWNFALNEVTIHKKDNLSMIVVHVYINDQFLNSYWSDGLLISTPTGSTGYSLSVGGPIVAPGSDNFIISPIATHNLTVRPFVIPDSSVIKLKVTGRSNSFMVGLDSRFETIDSSIELEISKCDFSINLIQMSNRSFYDTIREKLKWGHDVRN
jgi:NAD+ kinase